MQASAPFPARLRARRSALATSGALTPPLQPRLVLRPLQPLTRGGRDRSRLTDYTRGRWPNQRRRRRSERARGRRSASSWSIVILYGSILVIANRNNVAVNFVFFKTEASLFVVLILAIALGFVVGWLFDDLRDRRRRRKLRGLTTAPAGAEPPLEQRREQGDAFGDALG